MHYLLIFQVNSRLLCTYAMSHKRPRKHSLVLRSCIEPQVSAHSHMEKLSCQPPSCNTVIPRNISRYARTPLSHTQYGMPLMSWQLRAQVAVRSLCPELQIKMAGCPLLVPQTYCPMCQNGMLALGWDHRHGIAQNLLVLEGRDFLPFWHGCTVENWATPKVAKERTVASVVSCILVVEAGEDSCPVVRLLLEFTANSWSRSYIYTRRRQLH